MVFNFCFKGGESRFLMKYLLNSFMHIEVDKHFRGLRSAAANGQ